MCSAIDHPTSRRENSRSPWPDTGSAVSAWQIRDAADVSGGASTHRSEPHLVNLMVMTRQVPLGPSKVTCRENVSCRATLASPEPTPRTRRSSEIVHTDESTVSPDAAESTPWLYGTSTSQQGAARFYGSLLFTTDRRRNYGRVLAVPFGRTQAGAVLRQSQAWRAGCTR